MLCGLFNSYAMASSAFVSVGCLKLLLLAQLHLPGRRIRASSGLQASYLLPASGGGGLPF